MTINGAVDHQNQQANHPQPSRNYSFRQTLSQSVHDSFCRGWNYLNPFAYKRSSDSNNAVTVYQHPLSRMYGYGLGWWHTSTYSTTRYSMYQVGPWFSNVNVNPGNVNRRDSIHTASTDHSMLSEDESTCSYYCRNVLATIKVFLPWIVLAILAFGILSVVSKSRIIGLAFSERIILLATVTPLLIGILWRIAFSRDASYEPIDDAPKILVNYDAEAQGTQYH